jgi:predicted transposase YdaD
MFERGDLKQTRFYQEIVEEERAEGRKEERERMLSLVVPHFLRLGLSVEQIAQELDVEVEAVARIIQ